MGAANLLSVAAARRYQAVPVGYVDPKTLLIAIVDPANVLAIDDIHMITGLNCKVAVAAADDVDGADQATEHARERGHRGGRRGRGGLDRARRRSPSCTSPPRTHR